MDCAFPAIDSKQTQSTGRLQVPYGHAVYVCGWIQGLTARAHQAIERARDAARVLALSDNEFIERELIPYFERLDAEVEKEIKVAIAKAFANLTPREKTKTYGANIDEFRQLYMEGGGTLTLRQPSVSGGAPPKKAKISVAVRGEKPPKLSYDHVVATSLREADQDESQALAAQNKAELRILPPEHLLKPSYLPPSLRESYRFTPRKCFMQMLKDGHAFRDVMKRHEDQFKYMLENDRKTYTKHACDRDGPFAFTATKTTR